ncbi:MAG TPA: H(+)/Cl(-) exchange transporter ClcA [Burkholderiales bacterium]|nr:H(+)/Cl(-) exchange transporter ClcA [Burkholderiales bacterium]
MQSESEINSEDHGGLIALALISLVVGAVSGFVAAIFRLALTQADYLRTTFIAWAHEEKAAGFLLVIGIISAATALAAWLVRRFSLEASGSGIPNIEAVMQDGRHPGPPLRLMLVKFLGGVLAIGSGLALGREGPSVQMGASIANLFGTTFHRSWADCKVLIAAGAGAGLATAFNAPIAGAIFVLEELVRRFDTRIAIAALGTSASAIAVARVLIGQTPDFHVVPQPYPGFGTVPVHIALGIIAGIVGVAYCRAILGALAFMDRLRRLPIELRAALVGVIVALLAWFAPDIVGGGDAITQNALNGTDALLTIALVFFIRFGLGAVSYAAGTPGGIFAPMLVLGAQIGLLFGTLCCFWFPGVASGPTAFAIVGMAALFTAVVRAPITGIVLATELTGSFTLLLPMLASCFAAMAVPTLLRVPPIYDSLRERLLRD